MTREVILHPLKRHTRLLYVHRKFGLRHPGNRTHTLLTPFGFRHVRSSTRARNANHIVPPKRHIFAGPVPGPAPPSLSACPRLSPPGETNSASGRTRLLPREKNWKGSISSEGVFKQQHPSFSICLRHNKHTHNSSRIWASKCGPGSTREEVFYARTFGGGRASLLRLLHSKYPFTFHLTSGNHAGSRHGGNFCRKWQAKSPSVLIPAPLLNFGSFDIESG